MRISISSLALAATLTAAASGCVVTARGHVEAPAAVVEVDEEPPPPRYETVEVRPGFVWITGHWYRAGGRWEWRQGYYERERAGYAWEPGRWEARGRGHVWVEGNWRAGGGGGGPAVRDHREERHEEHHDQGPVIRDHRH